MRGVQRPGAALPFGAEHVVKLAASACQTGVGSFSFCSVRRGGTWALVSGWLACLRWRLWFLVVRDRLRLGGRELRPAAHPLFLLAQEKKAKEVRPAGCDPAAFAAGRPGSGNGRGGPQNSLRAFGASFRQLRLVRAPSVDILRCPRATRPLRFSARTEGMGETIRAIASLGLGSPHPCPLPGGEGVKPWLGGWSLGLCPCPSPSPSLGLGLGLGLGRRLVLV